MYGDMYIERDRHTYTHAHTHTYIYIYIYISPKKTPAVEPLAFYLTNHLKMKRTCWALLEKQRPTHKRCSPVNYYTWTHQ